MVACAGVPITACGRGDAAEEVLRVATNRLDRGVDVHLCNAFTLALADREPTMKSTLQASAMNFPDGKSVVCPYQLLHRGRGIPSNRVYGPDLLLDVFALGAAVGLRHYLLGSTPAVLSRLQNELNRRFPDAVIVGSESPPFRPLTEIEQEGQRDQITSSGAQIVRVGMGTPTQELEVARLAERAPTVFYAVGAAFDLVAGTKKQAPPWMQERGLEWLYRLATEPRRLWKRYVFGNLRFVGAVISNRTLSCADPYASMRASER